MTNERDMNDVDELVSATYHELADEQTPERLDRAVLEMAAGKRPRSSAGTFWLSAWMKPIAWAATIALSLAIVLEFTEVPNGSDRMGIAPPAAESVQDEFSPQNTQVLGRAERRANLQAGPTVEEEPAPATTIVLPKKAEETKINAVAASAPGANVPAARKKAVRDDDSGEVDWSARLREEKSEPMPSNNFVRAAAPLKDIAIEQSADMAVAAADCTPEARLTAESWLACIKVMRTGGAADAAEREYKAFADEFPVEFTIIEANK